MPTLRQHAEWVADYVRTRVGRPVCLLGHSVGGAIAMLAASLLPGSVRMVINVEGNFTLNDAFWCRRIAAMSEGTPVHLLAGERSCAGWDVPAWVRSAADTSTVLTGVGHMMMLEAPGRFCNAVAALLPSARSPSNR